MQIFIVFLITWFFLGAWGAERPQITICGRVKGRLRSRRSYCRRAALCGIMRQVACRAHLGVGRCVAISGTFGTFGHKSTYSGRTQFAPTPHTAVCSIIYKYLHKKIPYLLQVREYFLLLFSWCVFDKVVKHLALQGSKFKVGFTVKV